MSMIARIRAGWRGFWTGGATDNAGWIPTNGDSPFDTSSQSEEQYLGISAYFACVRNISEDIGKLPLLLYKRFDPRGKERATNHKYYQLIRYRPHQAISSAALRETLVRFALAWGNGYARIFRQNDGGARTIMPVHPQHVRIGPDADGGVQYIIQKPNKDKIIVRGMDMIHVHGVGSNGVTGLSVAAHALQSMTMAGAVRTFGTNVYTTNGRPAGFLKTASKLGPEAREANVTAWKKAHAGNRMGGTAMLDNGLDYTQVSVNPTDAQFLETCQYTIEEVARWFRMPLHKVQHLVRAQGWSTLDAQNTDYLTDTLMPWLKRIEDEFTFKLLGGHDEFFTEHLVDSILRGDIKTRGRFYVQQFSIGALSINEIRAMENRNPIEEEGGDTHFVPLNMTPAEFADSVSGNGSDEKGD